MTLRLRPVRRSPYAVQAYHALQGSSSGPANPLAHPSQLSSTREPRFPAYQVKLVKVSPILQLKGRAIPQDARDGLAKLHGEPVRADINDEKVKIEGAAATKPAQRTVLDALVRQLHLSTQNISPA